jgi:hypothetical protein
VNASFRTMSERTRPNLKAEEHIIQEVLHKGYHSGSVASPWL